MGVGRVIRCPSSSPSLHIPKHLSQSPSLPHPRPLKSLEEKPQPPPLFTGLPLLGTLAQRSVPREEGPRDARNQPPLLALRISQPQPQEVSNHLSRPTGDSPRAKDRVRKCG